jgi:hypothetical protein
MVNMHPKYDTKRQYKNLGPSLAQKRFGTLHCIYFIFIRICSYHLMDGGKWNTSFVYDLTQFDKNSRK